MEAQKTNRRDFLKVAAGTVGAGVAVASGLGAGVKASAATTIVRTQAVEPTGVFWGLNYQPHVQAYQRMADLFHKQYGSKITVQPQPGVPYANLIAAIAAGTQPDLCFTLGNFMTALTLQGALTDLTTSVYKYMHVDNQQKYWVGDAVEVWSLNNKIYGVPCETDGAGGYAINVPVDDLKKLGIYKKYPPGNGKAFFDSYQQFWDLAKALQVVKNGKVVRYGLTGEGWDDGIMNTIMTTLGTPPFDQEHGTFHYNSPAAVEAMNLHVVEPVKRGIEREWNDTTAVIDMPLQGKAAMSYGNGTPSFIGGQYGYHFVTVASVKINGKEPTGIGTGGGWGTVAPVKAQHPNLQTAFLRMMCTNAGQEAYLVTAEGINVMAWKPLLYDLSRYQPKNDTNGEWVAWKQGWIAPLILNTKFIGQAGYYNRVFSAIVAACQGVRGGKLTAVQGCAQIQQAAEAQYRQYKIDLSNLQ